MIDRRVCERFNDCKFNHYNYKIWNRQTAKKNYKNTKLLASKKLSLNSKKKLSLIGDIKQVRFFVAIEEKSFITWQIVNFKIKINSVRVSINAANCDGHYATVTVCCNTYKLCLRNTRDQITSIFSTVD